MNKIQSLMLKVSLPVVAAMLFGCPPATQPGKGPAATQPTPVAAVVLDAKALTPLANLQPAIAKPVNRAPTTTAANVTDIRPMLADAEKKLAEGDYGGARETVERAVRFEPNNARALKNLGLAYTGLENWGRAADNLQKSAAAAPDDLEVQLLLGKSMVILERNDTAITAFRTALLTSKAKPSDPMTADALLQLGDLLRRTGYLTAALDAYNQLSEWIAAHSDNYTHNASLQSLLLAPEKLLVKRGSLMLKLDKPKQASELLAKAYSSDRGDPEVPRLLAEALAKDKQFDRAAALILELATQSAQQAQVVPLTVSLANASGNKELPLKIWQTYIATGKKESDVAMSMARASLELGLPAQAQTILESALQKQPGSAVVNKALVAVQLATGQYEQAMTRLAAVIAVDANQSIEVGRILRQISAAAGPEFHRQFAQKYAADTTKQSAAVHYLAGVLAGVRGDRALAAKQYEQAIQSDADFLLTYDSMLTMYLEQRQMSDAQKLLDRVGKLNDAQYGYFKAYLRGRFKLATGNVEGAITDLESAGELRQDYIPGMIGLARAYLAGSDKTNDRSNDAVRVLVKAVRTDPDNEDLYRMLANLFVQGGRIGDAQEVLKQLMARHPGSVIGQIMQAELFLINKEQPKAQELVNQLKKTVPNNPDVQWLDLLLTYEGRLDKLSDKEWPEAVDRVRAILKAEPAKVDALRLLLGLLALPAHKSQAVEIWGKVYEETNKPLPIAKIYAEVLFQDAKYEKAAGILETVLQANPRDNALRTMLLACLQKLNKMDRAAQLAESWLKDAQDEQERLAYRTLLLKSYEDSKQYDKAHALLDDWIVLEADASKLRALRMGKLGLYGKAKRYDQAVEYGQKWISEAQRTDPQTATSARAALLQVLEEGKQYEKALSLVSEFIRKDPENSVWKMQQILLYGDAGQLDKGRQVALDMIAKNPAELDGREAVVIMYRKAQKYDQALALVDSWLAQGETKTPATSSAPATKPTTKPTTGPAPAAEAGLPPEVMDWCRGQAVSLLMAQEKYADAIKRADIYIPLYKDWKAPPPQPPRFPQPQPQREQRNPAVLLQITKASCLGELGQKDQQIAMLEKLYAQFPNDSSLKNDLGYTYAERGINLDKAERMIREALAAEGNSASVMDSLGWVFYKQGKFDAAGRQFDQILSMDEVKDGESVAVLFDHAGDVAWRMGNKDKAKILWMQALDKATRDKSPSSDTRKVKASAKDKLEALKNNKEPAVAPLGQGAGTTTQPAKK